MQRFGASHLRLKRGRGFVSRWPLLSLFRPPANIYQNIVITRQIYLVGPALLFRLACRDSRRGDWSKSNRCCASPKLYISLGCIADIGGAVSPACVQTRTQL